MDQLDQPNFVTIEAGMTDAADRFKCVGELMMELYNNIKNVQNMQLPDNAQQVGPIAEEDVQLGKEIKAAWDKIKVFEERVADLQKYCEKQNKRLEMNQLSRFHNSRIFQSSAPLEQLCDIQGNVINGFPPTASAIDTLDDEGINHVLKALGLLIEGTLDAKKGRLRGHIGLSVIS